MDLLKRHWEKILLTTALLVLLAAAGVLLLKIGALTQDVSTLPSRFRQGKETAALNVTPYETAIERLTNPVQWSEMKADPFTLSSNVDTNPSIPPTNTPPPLDNTTITLLSVDQVPFTMIFLAYVGEGRNFQLNLQFRPKTYFVEKVGDEVKDQYGNTGYFATNFVKKTAKEFDAKLNAVRDKDVSELTLQHKGEQPIVLVLGKPGKGGEPVATVECNRGAHGVTRTQIRRGQYFRCGFITYNVVDIKADEMLIKDAKKQEEKPVTIKLKSATPVNQEEGAAGGTNEPGNQNQ